MGRGRSLSPGAARFSDSKTIKRSKSSPAHLPFTQTTLRTLHEMVHYLEVLVQCADSTQALEHECQHLCKSKCTEAYRSPQIHPRDRPMTTWEERHLAWYSKGDRGLLFGRGTQEGDKVYEMVMEAAEVALKEYQGALNESEEGKWLWRRLRRLCQIRPGGESVVEDVARGGSAEFHEVLRRFDALLRMEVEDGS